MTTTAPPRPPPSDPVTHGEFDDLVEALIEEARQRGRRRRRRRGAVAVLVGVVGVGLFALLGQGAQSQDASPAVSARINAAAQAGTSRIAYISELGLGGGYCGTVWVMNPDGSDQRRLTSRPQRCWQETEPAWSPDGRRIAVPSGPPAGFRSGAPSGIYVMNVDASGERRVGGGSDPSWSPDGRRISFTRSGPNKKAFEINVVNADGTDQRRLGAGTSPVWSPEGRRIAFVRSVGRGRHSTEIYIVNADGSGQRRLTRNRVPDTNPVWSPDGRKIAFVSNWQVWVMNANGSGQRRLTLNEGRNVAPAWSPSGQRIAFERRHGRLKFGEWCWGCGDAAHFEVWVMKADGSEARLLARDAAQEPSWSPDGRKIAFKGRQTGEGQSDLYVMNADGSGQRNLTRAAGNRESQPVWSPAQK